MGYLPVVSASDFQSDDFRYMRSTSSDHDSGNLEVEFLRQISSHDIVPTMCTVMAATSVRIQVVGA